MGGYAEITDAALGDLVRRFYAKVRGHADLGPIFNAAVEDWDEHLARLTDFWSSVMLTTGRYKGSPLQAHAPLPITGAHFEMWLGLWREAARELFVPDLAEALIDKAERIAASLQAGLFFQLQGR
jgi:hemoglobin